VRDGGAIRRRRECNSCGCRFTTYEEIDRDELIVVKRNGERQPFSRQKLEQGIHAACRKRQISAETVRSIVDDVVASIVGEEISSEEIGEHVMRKLHDVDPVAYVRFASVYRGFTDVDQFVAMISDLKR